MHKTRKNKPKIGIFGGSFNPVHMGHLIMAQDALEFFGLAKVLFVPCNLPPHKDPSQLASPAHRAAMLALAIRENPRFELCDLEIKKGGTNYSIDTVRHLRKIYPRHALYFIIGSDSLLELHQWKEVNALLKLCRFVTFVRPGFELKFANKDMLRKLRKDIIDVHLVDISSTDIRRRAATGMSIRYLVPRRVEKYIARHALYRPDCKNAP